MLVLNSKAQRSSVEVSDLDNSSSIFRYLENFDCETKTSEFIQSGLREMATLGDLSLFEQYLHRYRYYDLNSYMIATCFEELGEPEQANRYYQRAAMQGEEKAVDKLCVQGPELVMKNHKGEISKSKNVMYEVHLKYKRDSAIFARSVVLRSQGETKSADTLLESSAENDCPQAIAELIIQKCYQGESSSAAYLASDLKDLEDVPSSLRAAICLGQYGEYEACLKLLHAASVVGSVDADVMLGLIAHKSNDIYEAHTRWSNAANKNHPMGIYYLACPPDMGDEGEESFDAITLGNLHRASKLGSRMASSTLLRYYRARKSEIEMDFKFSVYAKTVDEKFSAPFLADPDYDVDDLSVAYWYFLAEEGNVPGLLQIAYRLLRNGKEDLARKIYTKILNSGRGPAADLLIELREIEYNSDAFKEIAAKLHPVLERQMRRGWLD